jgi:hypothetical protein
LHDAARIAVGSWRATSTAKLGPERTTTGRAGPTSCAITCDIRRSVSASRPFVVLTNTALGAAYLAASRMTTRQPWEGIADTIRSRPATASATCCVIETVGGNGTPGMYTPFTRVARISSTSAPSRAHRQTS